ncbi:RICIN domain-containing protein [Actinoplanes sp. L3-i22]|uniref:RICIN domain-containing protein n=1 Tax=Actinoplanes sp. L3-i22 TaxID=2836373 RepID=UPI001C76FEF6|nr:RICIN domain-containing protein [Actinoplanes sp. L3-i22]BCY09922.1 hypothetical protein L3i22_050100 [Actinoplanes sp. L3-i22]
MWTYGAGNTDQQWTLLATDVYNVYKLLNRHSGKCLAIGNAATAGGEQAIEWTCEANHPEQEWRIVDDR